MSSYRACWLFLAVSVASPIYAHGATQNDALQFFERRVRPLLAANCFECHGREQQNGNLRLDSLDAILKGGDLGPAVIPGKPDQSLIVQAIGYTSESLQMPPTGKLGAPEIEIIRQWIQTGAHWPDSQAADTTTASEAVFQITDASRGHWSFQPIQPQDVPLQDDSLCRNEIDAFILDRLQQHGLEQRSPADRRTLIRRATYDLLGLPPSADEVQQFVNDSAPDAYERLIDSLLQSPHYGERWGQHWLDIVRFAQTDGYQNDKEKPNSWRYRDYVIRSFNEDKPFDRFVLEQLAGDELPDATPESVIGTGFLRLGLWNNEPVDEKHGLSEEYDEMVRTTSEAFLGLTVGCARCHDHKTDPISQEDYYRLTAFFQNVLSYGTRIDEITFRFNPDSASTPLYSSSHREAWHQFKRDCDKLVEEVKDESQRRQLLDKVKEDFLAKIDDSALSVRESGSGPPPTHILIRGNPHAIGKEVGPGTLRVLDHLTNPLVIDVPDRSKCNSYQCSLANLGVQATSGRRLALAKWIVDHRNPLTARVAVNRLWHYHFGRGIVATPSDFGRTGQPPSHPALLDWLAHQLMSNGWRLKPMHKLIMLSNTYCQSSRIDDDSAATIDPQNALLWRQNLRRLEAESFRDSILFISGRLNRKSGGRGFFPKLPDEVLATQTRPGAGWESSDDQEVLRRSIYIYVKRALTIPLLETLDRPNPDIAEPARAVTTVAPQALMLLNSNFIEEEANAFAIRLRRDAGEDIDAQLKRAVMLALAREPTDREHLMLRRLFDSQHKTELNAGKAPETARHNALCLISKLIFNLNEFAYVD